MKKYTFILAAALAVLAGCSREEQDTPEQEIVPELEPAGPARDVHFIVSDDVVSKATLDYTDGFLWDASADAARFGVFTDAPSHAAASSIAVGADKRADVSVSVDAAATKAFLYHGSAYNQEGLAGTSFAWFSMAATQSQASAGTLDNTVDKIILASAPMNVGGGETSVQTRLNMLSTFACFNIYASEGSTETVSSVKFEAASAGNALAGKAHVRFPFDGEAAVYEYAEAASSVTVNLTNAYDLSSATDKASAQGIFMGLLPAEVSGYTITVTTNAGQYTFTTTGSITFAAGKVKPINLDLKNATTSPAVGVKELTFVYGNPATSVSFGKSGNDQFMNGAIQQLVYGGVYLFNAGAKQEGFEAEKLSIVTDDASTAWLHASFENTNNYQMLVKADANTTDAARSGFVYLVYDGVKSTNYITVNQDPGPYYVVTPTLTKVYDTEIDKDGETIAVAAKLALSVNGVPQTDVLSAFNTYGVTLSCGAATATVTNSAGDIQIVFPANGGSTVRNYTLTASGATSSSVSFTQAAGQGGGGSTGPAYSYDVAFCAYPNGQFAGFPANASAQGVYLRLTNVKVDGATVPLTDEIVAAVIAEATDSVDPTSEEKGAGYASYSYDSAIRLAVNNYAGSQIELGISSGATGGIAKLTYHSSDNSTTGYFFIFVP